MPRCFSRWRLRSRPRSTQPAALEEAQSDGRIPIHAAKAYCADAFMRVAADNVQIHGGIGFTWEHAAQLYYKRAKSDQLLIGSSPRIAERAAVCLEAMYAH